ncbi:MAG TPA: Uma2 family endonuclease [Tepidisphaeraceae bacterium]|nr:Uma2 family endonuclease [Tepidisphaeraceae bacterium]
MTALPIPSRSRYTLADYLAFEESKPTKHEFHDGEILAMSGSSPDHALITANMLAVIHGGLKGKPCRAYSSDLKIGVPPARRVLYPDASVVCGALEYHPEDPRRRIVTNPQLVAEVLSPSSASFDRVEKFALYRSIPSLREYVLVSQERPLIETFVRQADGVWIIAGAYTGMDSVARFASIEVDVPLAEVFAGIEFPPPPSDEEIYGRPQ